MGKVPKLRFEGFEGDWEDFKVSEITTSYSGGTPKVGIYKYYNGTIPFIRSGELYEDHTELFLTQKGLDNSSAKMVSKGDILYALYGATSGEVSRARIAGAINQAILAIIPNEKYSADFLVEWFRKEKTNIIDKYLQGGQGNLSAQIIKNLQISIPSSEEQEKIGESFSEINKLLALHQRKHAALLKAKQFYLQNLFPRKGEKTPRLRFAGFSGEWEEKKLGETAAFSKGSGYSKGDLKDSGTPIILYGRLYTNYETVIEKIDTFSEVKHGAVISQGGEVIVPASGETAEDISVASVVKDSGVLLGGDLNIIKPSERILSIFLAISISFGSVHKEMAKKAQGKSIVHLHKSDLEKVYLSFPTIEEQYSISELISHLDHLITTHQRKLETLKRLKQFLLQNLFV